MSTRESTPRRSTSTTLVHLLPSGKGANRWFRASFLVLLGLSGTLVYGAVLNESQPVETWLMGSWLELWAAVIALQLACLGGGSALLELLKLRKALTCGERFLFSHALGLVLFVWGIYVAGALAQLNAAFAIGWPLVLVLVGLATALRSGELRASAVQRVSNVFAATKRGWTLPAILAVGAGTAAFVLLYLQCCTPDAINFDASWYHIPIAQDYAREGRIVRFPSDYNRAFPHLTSLVFTWGFLLPGLARPLQWSLALHLEFSLVVWKAVGVGVAAAWLLGRSRLRGGWAGLFLLPGLFVYDENIGGSADHVLGYFAIPVFLAVGLAWERWDRPRWILLGIMLGGATLTKYQAVYFWAGAGGVLGVRWCLEAWRCGRLERFLPEPLRRWCTQCVDREAGYDTGEREASAAKVQLWSLLWAPVVVAGVALLVTSPHFVKNILFHNNPVYPFAQRLFTASVPAHEQSAFYFQEMYANRPYLPKGEGLARLWNSLALIFTHSFVPHYSFTKSVPVFGSLFTLLMPALVVLRGTRRLWIGTVFIWLGLFAWANTYTSDRYLQGLVSVPAAVSAAIIVRLWHEGWIARCAAALPVTLQLLWSADVPFYSGRERIEDAMRLFSTTYDGKLSDRERFPYRLDHVAITEATPEDAVILVRNYRTTLGIDRTVYSDIQAWESFIFYEPVRSPAALDALYRERGITHLLYPEGNRPLDPLQASVLFADYARRAGAPQRFGSLVLRSVPQEPLPATEEPYTVLVSSVDFYRDGLYPVQELKAYERMPKALRHRAKAIERLTGDNASALMARASAVVVGKGDRDLRDMLGNWIQLERFSAHTIYGRR